MGDVRLLCGTLAGLVCALFVGAHGSRQLNSVAVGCCNFTLMERGRALHGWLQTRIAGRPSDASIEPPPASSAAAPPLVLPPQPGAPPTVVVIPQAPNPPPAAPPPVPIPSAATNGVPVDAVGLAAVNALQSNPPAAGPAPVDPTTQQQSFANQGVPVDAVGLQAAGADGQGGTSSSDNGINVVTSTPVALSNPIDILGGNYQATGGAALGGFGG